MLHTDSSLNHISLEYAYSELQQASQNFSAATRLGAGSFGGVYRGVMRDGTEVAVKVLELPAESGFEEEVRVLSKFRHPNLVILMGFARNDKQRCLVYELLGGGDVFKRLQKSCAENVPFTGRQRVSVALDAACGLSHLHHASPKVFHRDIKSPNILLDRNGTAKMADFGLACISQAEKHKVSQASGTVGYACPLYVQRGVVTEGSEVYSFGMVLFELITASPPAYATPAPDGTQQYQFLISHINGDIRNVVQFADAKAQWSPQDLHSCGQMALRCTQMTEESRPGFTEIVQTMRQVRDSPETAPMVQVPAAAAGVVQTVVPQMVHQAGMPGLVQVQAPGQHVPMNQQQVHAQQMQQQRAVVGPGGQVMVGPGAPQAQGAPAMLRISGPGALAGGQVVQMQPQAQQQVVNAVKSPRRQGQQQVVGPGAGISFNPVQVVVQQQLQPHAQKMSSQLPILWSLECVFVEGTDLTHVLRDRRTIDHLWEAGGGYLATFRVGRLFQEDFFNAIGTQESSRGAVSREHFQIWAEELPDTCLPQAGTDGRRPCAFFLTNFSGNGTIVNGVHLRDRGQQVALHQGDSISLARGPAHTEAEAWGRQMPFLEFRFDLNGSVLRESELVSLPASEVGAPSTVMAGGGGGGIAEGLPPPRPNSLLAPCGAGASPADLSVPVTGASALIRTSSPGSGAPANSLFVLEVGGAAVRDGVAAELRRIFHGSSAAQQSPCPLLILGRAHQSGFWQRILRSEAFNTLSRQHLEIETLDSQDGTEGPSLHISSVRNLSDSNPIRVCPDLEDATIDESAPLERNERRSLRHGDRIVVNPSQENMLWLWFQEIRPDTLHRLTIR